MKQLLNLKIAVGLLSSAAITGTLFAGLNLATESVPAHWALAPGHPITPVEVTLVNAPNGAFQCEWKGVDSPMRVAQCPTLQVTASRRQSGSEIAPHASIASAGEVTQLAVGAAERGGRLGRAQQ